MLRSPFCSVLPIDKLKSSRRFIRNRYIDFGQVYRMAKALRGTPNILAQSEQSGYQAALALAASFSSNHLGIIFHGHRWWTRRNRALAGIAGRMKSVQFLCLSQALRSLVLQEYGVHPDRVQATGFGVDARFFQPVPREGAGCIVSAGTASRDYKTLVEASAGLRIPVNIAADSTWYREELNVGTTSLPDNVRVFSCGTYAELRDLYGKALFVVVPLRDVRYACGYAVMAEAMAMGKAVIATRTASPSDLITEGVTGFYVPAGDVHALREAMVRLLADPDLAERMGRAGREAVEREFNLDAYVSRLASALGVRL